LVFVGLVAFVTVSLASAARHGAADYDGVKPGSDNKPPGPDVSGKGRFVTFPGFELLPNGRSRVFVQTSAHIEPVITQVSGRFEIVLRDTKVHLRNNRRPLETEHFDTPLRRASVEQRKRDAVLVLEMKQRVDSVQVHVQPGEDGYFFVFVELPATR
jgi:hypothetical protein